MSHATEGGASFTPFPHTFQTLNNILMIDCFLVTSMIAHRSVIRMGI